VGAALLAWSLRTPKESTAAAPVKSPTAATALALVALGDLVPQGRHGLRGRIELTDEKVQAVLSDGRHDLGLFAGIGPEDAERAARVLERGAQRPSGGEVIVVIEQDRGGHGAVAAFVDRPQQRAAARRSATSPEIERECVGGAAATSCGANVAVPDLEAPCGTMVE